MDARFNENGNGGDLTLTANDLAVVFGVENMPYLSMFGGNDYWGNSILLSNGVSWTYISTTEAALLTNALNSQGRAAIEQAVITDLQRLVTDITGTQLTVSVVIISDNELSINILFNGQQFNYLWNPKTYELTPTI